MIASPHHSYRHGKTVRLVVLHTAEGATTVESLGKWFQRPATKASSHVGIDDQRTESYVSYDQAAWTLRSGNAISDNAELCGFARWSRPEWLRHDQMLTLASLWVRDRCIARGVPLRKLTPEQVKAGASGVIGHIDWTVGMHDGTHTDPGPNFPWDVVLARAAGTEIGTGGGAGGTIYAHYGERRDKVLKLQQFLTRMFPSYNAYAPTGFYGDATKAGVAEFQRRVGVTGPDADGSVVGPRTLAALSRYGFSP